MLLNSFGLCFSFCSFFLRLETFEIELAALSDCHKTRGDGTVCFNMAMKLSPQSLVVGHRFLVCGS